MSENQATSNRGCLRRILKIIGFVVVTSTICGGIFYYQYTHPSEDGECQKAITELKNSQKPATQFDYSDLLPHPTQPITLANIKQLHEIKRLGRGYIKEIFWSNDDLMVLTTVGLWRHSHTDWQAEPKLIWTTNQYNDDYVISSDGSLIAIISHDTGKIPVLDSATGKVLQTFNFHRNHKTLVRVAISPDNSLLAAAFGFDAQVWDIKTGEIIHVFSDEKFMLLDTVAFSPDNQLLAVGGTDSSLKNNIDGRPWIVYGTVRVWNLTSIEKVADIDTIDGEADNIAFSPDGSILATGDSSLPRYARLWDLKTARLITKLPMSTKRPDGSTALPFRVTFSSDGRRFAFGYLLWAEGLTKPPLTMDIFDVSFNQAGTLVAGLPWLENSKFYEFEQYLDAASEGNIRIWDVENGKKLVELPDFYGISPIPLTAEMMSHKTTPTKYFHTHGNDLAIQTKTSKFLVVASNPMDVFPLPPPAIRVCDPSGVQIMSFRMPPYSWLVNDIVISPDERLVAFETNAGVYVMDIDTRTFSQVTPYFVQGMAFTSDSSLLAVSYRASPSSEIGIGIWNTQTKTELTLLQGHTSTLNAIEFTDNDALLLTYGLDGTVRFWGISSDE